MLNKYLFFLIVFLIIGCSGKKEKVISVLAEDEIEQQMIEAYNKGIESFKERDFLSAAKEFSEAELLFPQSEWAAKASLMAAYSYYTDEYYNDSIFQLEQFIKVYPSSSRISYAHYLLAMSYYNKI